MVKAADKALELTAKGKGRAFMAGALGGGVAEGVFIGDVESRYVWRSYWWTN